MAGFVVFIRNSFFVVVMFDMWAGSLWSPSCAPVYRYTSSSLQGSSESVDGMQYDRIKIPQAC